MTGKILMALVVLMVAMAANASAEPISNKSTDSSNSQNQVNIPDAAQIGSDLAGNYMYIGEGLPKLWEFPSPASVKTGSIRTSRIDGDRLELNFTVFFVDEKTGQRGHYRADTLVTYTQVDGTWEFFSVEGKSIKRMDPDGLNPVFYSEQDC